LYYNYNSSDFAKAMAAGFKGHPAFDFRTAVHHDNVLPIFMKRVPPRSRSDFRQFLFKHGLSSFPGASDFALLGYSGARLPGDGFSLEIDFLLEAPPFQYFFEISGFRYYQGMHVQMNDLIGQQVFLLPEPANPYDPNAIQLTVSNLLLGYVPRTQAAEFKTWLNYASVGAWIDRIEGTPLRPQVSVFTMIGPPSSPPLALS